MTKKVSLEKATEEITGWLDKKKVYESTRDSQKDSVDLLIEAIMNGDLTLNEKGEFTHHLLFPVGGLISINYKSRMNDQVVRPFLNGIKATDGEGRWMAHLMALTDQPKNILSALDTADKKIMTAIMVFFI